jgi:hypothetical protein
MLVPIAVSWRSTFTGWNAGATAAGDVLAVDGARAVVLGAGASAGSVAGVMLGSRPLAHPKESKALKQVPTNPLRKAAIAGTMEGRALL